MLCNWREGGLCSCRGFQGKDGERPSGSLKPPLLRLVAPDATPLLPIDTSGPVLPSPDPHPCVLCSELDSEPLCYVSVEREEPASVGYQRSQVWSGCPRLTNREPYKSASLCLTTASRRLSESRTQLYKMHILVLGSQFLDTSDSRFFFNSYVLIRIYLSCFWVCRALLFANSPDGFFPYSLAQQTTP